MKPTNQHLVVNVPVSVWEDGEDPHQAFSGQVCVVARNFVRVRVSGEYPSGTSVRMKTPQRTRSLIGRVGGSAEGPDGHLEMAIWADGIAAYFGVSFPKAGAASKAAPAEGEQQDAAGPDAAPGAQEERGKEPAEEPANEPAEIAVLPEPAPLRPVPQRLPEELPSRSLDVVISGIDSARSAFSQPVPARLDSSGSLRVHLKQLLDLGGRVRLTMTGKGEADQPHRYCRVYSRSPVRTLEGCWIYRLIFENVLDLFREFEPPSSGPGAAVKDTSRLDPLLAELRKLRSVLVALLYELRRRAVLEDDTLLADLLGCEIESLDSES